MTLADGSTVWVLANIEEVAVARGPVDERRALGTNSASYLLALEKDYGEIITLDEQDMPQI